MHRKYIAVIYLLAMMITLPGRLPAETDSHRQAVEKLFELTFMQQKIEASVENVLALQIRQNPALREQEDILRSFLEKHIGWESLKDDFLSMYLQTFTEQELNEVNKFYGSPTGRKLVQHLPELVKKRDNIAMQRLQEHANELQQEIDAHAGK